MSNEFFNKIILQNAKKLDSRLVYFATGQEYSENSFYFFGKAKSGDNYLYFTSYLYKSDNHFEIIDSVIEIRDEDLKMAHKDPSSYLDFIKKQVAGKIHLSQKKLIDLHGNEFQNFCINLRDQFTSVEEFFENFEEIDLSGLIEYYAQFNSESEDI